VLVFWLETSPKRKKKKKVENRIIVGET